jgi:hypothetical protein
MFHAAGHLVSFMPEPPHLLSCLLARFGGTFHHDVGILLVSVFLLLDGLCWYGLEVVRREGLSVQNRGLNYCQSRSAHCKSSRSEEIHGVGNSPAWVSKGQSLPLKGSPMNSKIGSGCLDALSTILYHSSSVGGTSLPLALHSCWYLLARFFNMASTLRLGTTRAVGSRMHSSSSSYQTM